MNKHCSCEFDADHKQTLECGFHIEQRNKLVLQNDVMRKALERLGSAEGFLAIGVIPSDQWGDEIKARMKYAQTTLEMTPTEKRNDAPTTEEIVNANCPCGCHRSTSECCGCPGNR